MTALGADAQISTKDSGLRSYKVADNVKIFKGAIVCIDTNGYANVGADTASFVCAGIAIEQCDNTQAGHAAGGKRVRVQSGKHFLLAATGMAQTSVGLAVMVKDSGSVGLTSTNSVKAGTVTEYVSATSVWVFMPGVERTI